MHPEDLLVTWVNVVLGHPSPASSSPSSTSATTPPPKDRRKLRDLSTDLRDSTLYRQLLQALAPELPTHKVDKLFDLHSKAKLILSLSALLGVRLPLTEFEYVEGAPDLHLLFLTSIFQKTAVRTSSATNTKAEPKRNVVANKIKRLHVLRTHWLHLRNLPDIPAVTAYSFLGHLNGLCLEVAVLQDRVQRRQALQDETIARVKNLAWTIQRARVAGIETQYYQTRHLNNMHNYAENGTIESLLAIDPVRIKHRLKYEHKQLSGRAEGALTSKERHQLVLSEQAEINKEIADIKRIFANHRVELKKIQKHYCTDPLTNEIQSGIDYESWLQFCRDCGFLAGRDKIPVNALHDVFHKCVSGGSGGGGDAAKTVDTPHAVAEDSTHAASDSSPLLLSPSQFLDGVIHLSHLKYSASYPGCLSARVQACVEMDVLVGACRTVVDEFRSSVASESVRAVFKAYKGKLSAVFRRYSTLDANDATVTPVTAANSSESNFAMTLPQFLALLSDAHVVQDSTNPAAGGGVLSESRLRVLFQTVQQDEDYGGDRDLNATQSEELSYVEFLEALAAIACWSRPDPFMPLATKLDTFLADTLFATLKKTTAA